MTSKLIADLQRRVGGFPIEVPAALMMAFAAGLVTLAMPDWRFEAMVAATGLGGIVGAAQPPLGQTARIVAALAAAGLSFAAVLFGLRALERKPRASDFPAFRAADLHPDAPKRRPILAGAEFGTPADDLPPAEELVTAKAVAMEPLPSFLAPQPREIGDFVPPAPFALPDDPVYVELPVAKPAEEPLGSTDARRESKAGEDVGGLMSRLERGLSRHKSAPIPGPAGPVKEQVRRAFGDLDQVARRTTEFSRQGKAAPRS